MPGLCFIFIAKIFLKRELEPRAMESLHWGKVKQFANEHACDNFDCPIAKLVPRMRFYRHAMPTIKQLLRNARQPIRNVTKSPALRGCPQRRGTCTRDRKEKGSEIGDMLRRIVSQIFFISSHFISSQINTRIQSGLKQDEKKRNAKASLDGDSDPETEPASS
ncbi:hypothetical protein IEQ34_024693 [Dendrobium chrysotoxum]|uniref:Uncharacterized protein n=1 Tax=Dendrobium chrysotoxum TaxID=161865 RepID=A0AAV7FRA9_DENCH|nr:hypothetical protein IEQ34_024693 [Dendrobium chrysotoxum]